MLSGRCCVPLPVNQSSAAAHPQHKLSCSRSPFDEDLPRNRAVQHLFPALFFGSASVPSNKTDARRLARQQLPFRLGGPWGARQSKKLTSQTVRFAANERRRRPTATHRASETKFWAQLCGLARSDWQFRLSSGEEAAFLAHVRVITRRFSGPVGHQDTTAARTTSKTPFLATE